MLARVFSVVASTFVLLSAPACADDRYGAVYDSEADAAESIDAALAMAQGREVPAFIVFGANWCHDSRGLAHRLETHEALSAFVASEYELVFVDVGERDNNLDQLERFGVNQIYGTPTLVVATGEGAILNAKSVHHWRTVDNADPADIGAYLAGLSEAALPIEPDAAADLTAVIAAWEPYQQALAALEESDLDSKASSVRLAYYEGFARSMARRALGLEAEEREIAVVDMADLPGDAGPVDDITAAVIMRLQETELDLVARGDRELERYEALRSDDGLTGEDP